MKLDKLLNNIDYNLIQGSDTVDINNIVYDSKNATPNTLFVCLKGIKTNTDGHNFALLAINNGATAILTERKVPNIPPHITIVRVRNTRKSLPTIANNFFNYPSKELNLVGITGTNGKTSVSLYIAKVLEVLERNVGVIGTTGVFINNQAVEFNKTTPTTPESVELQYLLRYMKNSGVTEVVMEASSMAMELHRVDGCDFNVAVFTNLTQDHLDDHKTMENYKNAKLKLFNMCKYAIINIDDSVSNEIININKCPILTYGIKNNADIFAKDITYSFEGVQFTVVFREIERQVKLNIPGDFSIYNALATIGACYVLGLPIDLIINGLEQVSTVPGRFEVITSTKGYQAIVDYAHSPDALENVLKTINGFVKGRIITIFGCGGDRDRTKRALMGEIAGKYSDMTFITSDNPRSENPNEIMNEIEFGIKKTNCPYIKIEDRKSAILNALNEASPNDIILIAGKGHEEYQEFKDYVIHFSDKEIINEFIKLNNFNPG